MPLVFAGVTPHPPLLIPTVGKEQAIAQLAKTKAGLEQLEKDLYLAKPHIIVVISPHEGIFQDAFVVNAHTTFTGSFEAFGDLVTKHEWNGSADLAAKISHVGNTSNLGIRLVSEQKLDYGTSIPLCYLTSHLPGVKILPIGFSGLTPADHVAFGEILKEVFVSYGKRVAVIASGDLSHCVTPEGPAPFSQAGSSFDTTIIDALTRNQLSIIEQMSPDVVHASHECGYRSILILMGILKEMNYNFHLHSYEYPFGIGYLVGNFVF